MVSFGGIMSTRYIVILDLLCWYLHISVSNLLFQTPQVCSDGVSFSPVSLVCVSVCVSTDNMLGHMGLAITVFLWARPQPESKVGGGVGYYWLTTVA